MPELVTDLTRLAAIPSIAFDGFDHGPVHEANDLIVELLPRRGGRADRTAGPAGQVADHHGHGARPPGAPTVLLYAHYDVQPPVIWRPGGPDPFTPTEIDGASTRRGVADDKSNLIAHVGALRVSRWPGSGRTLKIVFEASGRSEVARWTTYRPEHARRCSACDAMVDRRRWAHIEPCRPTFTTALA